MAASISAGSDLVFGPPAPRSRLGRQFARWRQQVGRALGLLRTVSVAGVQYREVSAEPLSRALSRKGRGHKDYRVVFPSGVKMIIRATPRRIFADLASSPPPLIQRYRRVEGLIVPGMRVLEFGCSTGYGAVWLAGRVGRSGAVVAIDSDDMAVLYAQRRYAPGNATNGGPAQPGGNTPGSVAGWGGANIAFEVRRPDSLAGETDGSFDAVFAPRLLSGEPSDTADLAELWRMVAPGGWLFIGAGSGVGSSLENAGAQNLPDRSALESLIRQICTAEPSPADREGRSTPPRPRSGPGVVQFIGDPMDGFLDAIVGKPDA